MKRYGGGKVMQQSSSPLVISVVMWSRVREVTDSIPEDLNLPKRPKTARSAREITAIANTATPNQRH